jgi:16S rRNA (uracil1498-N3)-methyltransferase
MSLPRFFVEVLPATGQVGLSPDDARHAQSALRLKIGDHVQLFNGQGLEADGEVVNLGRAAVQVSIANARAVSRELNNKLELAVALPKGDRQKQLIDLLVQLGVHELTPLECDRAVAQPTANAIERLQRTVIESSKQCGRNQLMKINQPTNISQLTSEQLLAGENATSQRHLKLFAHPYGECGSLIGQLQAAPGCVLYGRVVIGPEGGLNDAECQQLLQAGWTQVELGKRILRIETAAVMIAATWAAIS